MLLHADARKLPLADGSAGLVLTSPPYNVGLHYDGYDDNLSKADFMEFNRIWLAETFRVCKESTRAHFIIGDQMIWWFRKLAEDVGFVFAQKLVWCKPNFVSSSKKVTGDWNYMTEDILLFRKGKRTPMLNSDDSGTWNWFREVTPQSNFHEGRIHPAQLPVSLCKKIIARTPGEPILDPFAGSGSVLVAAKQLGRSAIGCDIIMPVVKRAQFRLQHTQPPLFSLAYEQNELEIT